MKRWATVVLAAALLSACASIPVEQMNLRSTIVTAGGEGARPKRVPQREFKQEDLIFVIVSFEWADVEKSAGRHEVNWKWYNNDKLVTVVKRSHEFSVSPWELWSHISAQSLGSGSNKVELYVDDKLITTQAFTVQ
jgi:hypothetical protein